MNKTKIEWCDYTLNPIKGLCKNECFYCYARAMYKRFKWDENIVFKPYELEKVNQIPPLAKIFLCSTHDLFGDWIPQKWIDYILNKISPMPHTYMILTKNPQRPYWDNLYFPNNTWFGITVTHNNDRDWSNIFHLIHEDEDEGIKAKIKFISFEPLIDELDTDNFHYWGDVNWFIIGAMTGRYKNIWKPTQEAIKRLLNVADKYNIPVFMKDNLDWEGEKRREFPNRKVL